MSHSESLKFPHNKNLNSTLTTGDALEVSQPRICDDELILVKEPTRCADTHQQHALKTKSR